MPDATGGIKTVADYYDAHDAERESNTTDTVGRDADYYFASRHVIAADKSQAGKYGHWGVGVVATGVYNALKGVRDRGEDKGGAILHMPR